MRKAGQRGFTLLEVVAVIGVVLILSGTLVPLVINHLDSARLARTRSDCQALAKAIVNFREDVREYPVRNGATASWWYMLRSGGNPPTFSGAAWGAGRSDTLADHLVRNTRGYAAFSATSQTGWNGPYLPDDRPDPWGRQYLVSVRGFWDTGGAPPYRVWVISAGPDGVLETDDQVETVSGDDIGECIYAAR